LYSDAVTAYPRESNLLPVYAWIRIIAVSLNGYANGQENGNPKKI
jgi:hypothetical protein